MMQGSFTIQTNNHDRTLIKPGISRGIHGFFSTQPHGAHAHTPHPDPRVLHFCFHNMNLRY